MVTLNRKSLADKQAWADAGIALPRYDVAVMREKTATAPRWVHIGPGNIFRGYIAALAQDLLNDGAMDTGITVVSTFDHQILDLIYAPCDDLALQVLMHADGKLDKNVIASIGESMRADRENQQNWNRVKEVFTNESLQMVSFTITEKGYHIRNMNGEFYPDVVADMASLDLSQPPRNGMATVAALLFARYQAGAKPIAMVSMDNFSHNGDKLHDSVTTIAHKWVEAGLADAGFAAYIDDPKQVSFPWSMIDKITPRPDATVAKNLKESGFASIDAVITDKNTYIAPFVNAEVPSYLVVEDCFPGGRPPLEKAGVYLTDRKTVDLVERMKVCTCLNPLHTAMCIVGCLLGYESIAAEMKDPAIAALVHRIGAIEGMPVVADPGILKPIDFLREVIEQRLPNPYIPDTPQRIATDTSQKLPIRFGETIRLYRQRTDLDISSLRAIPFAIAAWCRYLLALDDNGKPMTLSSDPLLEQLQDYLKDVKFGQPDSVGDSLRPILTSERIFGQDLYEAGLGTKIEGLFKELIAGPGAVRKIMEREVLSV